MSLRFARDAPLAIVMLCLVSEPAMGEAKPILAPSPFGGEIRHTWAFHQGEPPINHETSYEYDQGLPLVAQIGKCFFGPGVNEEQWARREMLLRRLPDDVCAAWRFSRRSRKH